MTQTAATAEPTHDQIDSLDELRHALDNHAHANVELGRYLLQHALITPAQLEKALASKALSPDRRLGEILVEQCALTIETLTNALSHVMGVPSVHLAHLEIDRTVIHRLSPDLVHRHHVIPIMLHHQGLVLACATLPDGSGPAGTVVPSRHLHLPGAGRRWTTFTRPSSCTTTRLQKISRPPTAWCASPSDDNYQQLWRDAEYLAKQAPIVRLVNSIRQRSHPPQGLRCPFATRCRFF
jgi:hypothetical protein